MKLGKFKLKEDARFIVGVSSIGLRKGAIVCVEQLDKTYGKVLVRFGGRDIDWMDSAKFDRLFEEV